MQEHLQEQQAAPPLPPPPNIPAGGYHPRGLALDVARRRGFAVIGWILNAAIGFVAFTSMTLDPGIMFVLSIAVVVFTIVTTARLAKAVHGTGVAWLCGIGVMIPLVWIGVAITLLITSGKLVKAGGGRVSFLGRDLIG